MSRRSSWVFRINSWVKIEDQSGLVVQKNAQFNDLKIQAPDCRRLSQVLEVSLRMSAWTVYYLEVEQCVRTAEDSNLAVCKTPHGHGLDILALGQAALYCWAYSVLRSGCKK